MAIIRGDRIGDGRKTSPLTAAQQDAYARFVATLPDDFGRVRLSWTLIVGAMYPREENPRKVGRLARRWRLFAEAFEAAGLLRVWEDDGIRWAEVVGWKPSQHKRGQAFHRTPEPPWGGHVHTGWCASTAIARLRDVGRGPQADELSKWLKDLRTRERDVKGVVKGGFSSLPSPPPPPPPVEQRTAPPPAAGPGKPRGGWPGRVVDMWPGEIKAGHAGKALGGVVGKYGEGPALAGLGRWLEAGNAKFGPEVFARDAEAWIKGHPQGARASPRTAAAVTVGAMQQILSEEAAKGDDRQGDVHGGAGGDGAPAQQAGRAGASRRLPPGVG